ncbi:MAG: hypothetical protein LBI57_03430 [Helicobacteraceae bacterium]|jgi:hypothetical protein|nr:hypothetical protein [Helicobacteraceae bacterium]
MASQVFSAKLRVVEFEYEIGDKRGTFSYRAPNTIEIDREIEMSASREGMPEYIKRKAAARISKVSGDLSAEKIIADQRENGNLYEFIGALEKLAENEKNAKARS